MNSRRMRGVRRVLTSMLAVLMIAAYLPVAGQPAFAEDGDLVKLTPEQAERIGVDWFDGLSITKEDAGKLEINSDQNDILTDEFQLSEEGFDDEAGFTLQETSQVEVGSSDIMHIPAEEIESGGVEGAAIDVVLDTETGLAAVSGYTTNGETFSGLYVDDDWCYDADINGSSRFETTIDMKDHPVGVHTIYATLDGYDFDESKYIRYQYGVPTLIYSKQKPTIKYDYFYTAPKYFAYYYGGSSLDQDSGCGVYLDYKKKGGKWVTGYGECSTSSSLRNVPSKKLKPNTSYTVKTYFGKQDSYNGVDYFIKSKYSSSKTVKTGSSKKLSIKSVKAKNVKVKYSGFRITTYNAWGQMVSSYPVYYTSFKIELKLKKKPGTTGVCIGSAYKKGNKKTYTNSYTWSGTQKAYKGKKIKFEFVSYQHKTYKGYSPKVSKKIKIK